MKCLAIVLLLVGAVMAQTWRGEMTWATPTDYRRRPTCHLDSTYIYSDPATNQSITLFCGSRWAVAIPISVVAEGNIERLATAYLPDHTFAGYLPVKSHSQEIECTDKRHCLVVTYGDTGSMNGLMWAWVTLDGIDN